VCSALSGKRLKAVHKNFAIKTMNRFYIPKKNGKGDLAAMAIKSLKEMP